MKKFSEFLDRPVAEAQLTVNKSFEYMKLWDKHYPKFMDVKKYLSNTLLLHPTQVDEVVKYMMKNLDILENN
jgi:hypothetical protein